MLIEFKFKNFKSFKNETSLLMTNVSSFKEHIDSNIINVPDRDFDLLKSAAIYGYNGVGKSNFMYAMSYMTGIIHNSFSNSLKKEDDKPDHDFQFKLSTESENSNTLFEVSFLLEEDIYRYGFEINGHEIKKEWLYKKIERENHLFIREGNSFDINNTSFEEGNKYKDDVNENVLFLSHLSQNNQKISRLIFDWISDVNTISGLSDNHYKKFTTKLIQKDSNFREWTSFALKYLEITNIEAGEEEGELVTYHNKYDENNLLIGSVPFLVSKEESAGTKKLIYLLGPIYDTLRYGRVLFVDEFDSKLHPNLTIRLVELFNKFNNRNAQLIITGHDTNLLNKKYFRRDQVWFIDKDQFGSSDLYSLSEFNAKTVRQDSAFDKKYLDNKFGASETLEVNQKLTDLLYGK